MAFAAQHNLVSLACCRRKACLCQIGHKQIRGLLVLAGRHMSMYGSAGIAQKSTAFMLSESGLPTTRLAVNCRVAKEKAV